MEEWKDIVGYEGLYQASNLGRVRSLDYHRTGKVRIMRPSNGGTNKSYLHIGLTKDKKLKTISVHRLVWEAFNGPIPEGYEINHLDENGLNNKLSNLVLVTHSENINYGTRSKKAGKKHRKMVEQYRLNGDHIMTWYYLSAIEEELGHMGFRANKISECCTGNRKSHKGYMWKYKKEQA